MIFKKLKNFWDKQKEDRRLDKILKEGTEKARKTAQETMRKVKEAMKLDYFE